MLIAPVSLELDATVSDPRRRRRILATTCVALMAVVASASGLNVAQQELARTFDASQPTVLWIVNAYLIALAATLMPIGAIGDRWGRKRVLVVGLVLFALASIGGALAPTAAVMITSRVIAGLAAAMIMPVTLSVITSTFPDSERSHAIGVWSGVAGAGGLLGMFASAALIDLVSWRWAFALPLLLAAAALVMAVSAIPSSRERHIHRFDLGGSILSMFAVGELVFAIHEGPSRGWADPLTLSFAVAGGLGLLGFVGWELRHPAPLLDVRMFGGRRLASGAGALTVLFGVMAGVFIVLFPFLQAVLGWSALLSTLGMLPMAVTMMVASGLASRLGTRTSMRAAMLIGIAVATVGLVVLATLVSVGGGYASVVPGMLIVGAGMGLTMPPSTEAITTALPREKQGVASALNDTTRELGSALGVALLGAILAAGYRDALVPHLEGLPVEAARAARRGIASALAVAPELERDAAALVRHAQHAFVEGWARSMWVSVAVMTVLFAYILVRGPERKAS